MTNLQDLTTGQLLRIIAIKKQIEKLQSQLESILGDDDKLQSPRATKKRRMSATARARIAAGARARWAKIKSEIAAPKKRRKMSAAGRAKIRAAAIARWKSAKASGKNRL